MWQVPIRCELKSCEDWVQYPYTTCYKHSVLIKKMGQEPTWLMAGGDYGRLRVPMDSNDFRFSASYASRYNHCHGSANLVEAIPGFQHPERNDNGMKGEGTRLHKIFEEIIDSKVDYRAAADVLMWISTLWGPKRFQMLDDEKAYIIGWFMQHKSAPPVELSVLREGLKWEATTYDAEGNENGKTWKGSAPRRIAFIADALRYVADLVNKMDPETLEIMTEVKEEAWWLETKPKTTVDLVIRDKNEMHVLDLKMGDLEVSPIQNEQLMYYSKTFIRRPDGTEYDNITLHIMQRNYTDSWGLPIKFLESWVSKVRASEQAIIAGDLTLSPGSHCTFCPANPHGRGDRGSKACPAMMAVLYGERDSAQADTDILEEDEVYA